MWPASRLHAALSIHHQQDMGSQGEGYKGSETESSPHTIHERYVGLVPLKIAEVFVFQGVGDTE